MKSLFYFLLVFISVPVYSASTGYTISDQNAPRQIRFSSEAPLEVVEGTAERFSGVVTFDPNTAELVSDARVRVAVASMETGHSLRDSHLRSAEWLSAEQHPTIQFSLLPGRDKAKKKGKDTWFLNARGDFSLKGVSRPITVPLTITQKRRNNKEELHIKGRFTVKLSEHNIRGPVGMKMIGARVNDAVQVDLNLVGLR